MCWPVLSARADFQVIAIVSTISGSELQVSGTLDLDLSEAAETAIDKGVPVVVQIRLALYRHRPLVWDKKLSQWSVRFRIRYHGLSGRYIVDNDREDGIESFASIQQALQFVGDLGPWTLELPEGQDSGGRFRLAVRTRLDIESLPAPLRPLAYTSPAWRLDSRWTQWRPES
ncbi:MAG: DUF4390 domain-containing protein [Gammaproteobacteria bacterium]|nr:DUF4390 domain-containing protein [Gammaproteobacteria bacterium]